MKKRVDGYFLIINSGPSLRHVNGLHLFFWRFILWLHICGVFVSEESCVRVFFFVVFFSLFI